MKLFILKNYIDEYEKNKIAIIKYWIINKEILNILKLHDIKRELFVKKYAIGVLDYYIDIIKENSDIGECKVIDELILYFKDKNITPSELFVICTGFKNALIEFTYDLKITNLQIEKEINYIFEKNFSGVLNMYSRTINDIEKELEEQQSMLVEQSKSAAMGEMISMIAHQWRQPLQAVSILIQKLPLNKALEGEISDELLNQVVIDIGSQLDYMSKTIDDFRDFFLPDKAEEKIAIIEVVNKSLDFLSFMTKNDSIEVSVDSKTDIEIKVHVNELVQVLINLIKNARDVLIERDIEERKIFIKYYEENDCLVIEIEDNAGGVPEEIISKIFDPYFSTKSNKNGTGLGLYMCKTIIEKHSLGLMEVRNSEKGAVFKISLPKNK